MTHYLMVEKVRQNLCFFVFPPIVTHIYIHMGYPKNVKCNKNKEGSDIYIFSKFLTKKQSHTIHDMTLTSAEYKPELLLTDFQGFPTN